MNEGGNPLASAVGFWMMIQLVSTLALLLGGLFALFCLSRAASSFDRLASAVEDLVARDAGTSRDAASSTTVGGAMPFTTPFTQTPVAPFSTPPISSAIASSSTPITPPAVSSNPAVSHSENNDEQSN